MANSSENRDSIKGNTGENRTGNDTRENDGNSKAHPTSMENADDESISTAGDTANGKGSRTGVRKDEKEENDSYDKGRA